MNIDEMLLGDAYELIKQLPDKSADLIVTDSPSWRCHAAGKENRIRADNAVLKGVFDEV